MKKIVIALALVITTGTIATAGIFDSLLNLGKPAGNAPSDDKSVVNGLKEALAVGTDRAVKSLGQENGYFGNAAVKILLPENIRKTANILSGLGFGAEVDEFVLSMNRAAEKAAPQAGKFFTGALKDMTFEDARTILQGSNTAATEYFEKKTRTGLADAFRPEVTKSLDQVGATRSYKQLVGRLNAVPFFSAESLDLDRYVTEKALDGLFLQLGEEEKKIRTHPVARTTELLKKVFGK